MSHNYFTDTVSSNIAPQRGDSFDDPGFLDLDGSNDGRFRIRLSKGDGAGFELIAQDAMLIAAGWIGQ
ncbi:MAG: hypothetical protein ACK2T3_16630 [Candidatus Promineifilaceae bacterium]